MPPPSMPPPPEVVGWTPPPAWQQAAPKPPPGPAWQGVAGGGDTAPLPGGPPPGRLSGRITIMGLAVAAVSALLLVVPLQDPRSWLLERDIGTYQTISSISSIAGLVVIIAYLAWSWRMASSVRMLTGAEPPIGRVGAVGWWFVPLANLIMPAVFVASLLNRLAIPGRRRHLWLVPVWWLAYLGSFGTSLAWSFQVAELLQEAASVEPLLALDTGLLVVGQVLTAVAAVALIAIVLLVSRDVATRYRAALQGWSPPPTG